MTMATRQRKAEYRTLGWTLVVALLLVSSVLGSNGKHVELVTPQEAALPDASPGPYEAGRDIETGPVVEIVAPEKGKSYKAPVPILIKFIPKNGKEIDISTLKVEYLKSWSIDITYKVLPYTTKDGINIPEADLPTGNHTIRLSVADVAGITTRVLIVVTVI